MRTPTPEASKDYDTQSEVETSIGTSHKEDRLYTQLLCTAGGQLVALLFVLLVYGVWEVLREYRNTIIWAVLCSIALRGCKDWLVLHCLSMLQQDRTLFQLGLKILFLPLSVVRSGFQDSREFMKRWQRYALEYESTVKERQRLATDVPASGSVSEAPQEPRVEELRSKERKSEDSGKAQATRRKQSKPKRRKPSRLPPLFKGLVEIGNLGLKAWRRQTSKRPLPRRLSSPAEETSSHSLLRGLLLICVLYQLFVWLHSSWSATIHLFLLTGTAAVSIGILPFLYLGGHLYLSLSAPEDSAAEKADGAGLLSPDGRPGSGGRAAWGESDILAGLRRTWMYRKYREVDGNVRLMLSSCIHSLVAALLVVGLVLGTACLIIFLSVRIGQESSAAVIAARDAAQEWTTSLPAHDDYAVAHKSPMRKWVVKQQAYLGQVLEDRLPDVTEWAEMQGQRLIAAYNLSQRGLKRNDVPIADDKCGN